MPENAMPLPWEARGRVRVLVMFILVLGVLCGLYYLESTLALGVWDRPYTRLVTWSSLQLGRLLLPDSLHATADAIQVDGRTTVFIASGCNGLEAIFLLLAGIIAYPASWLQRGRSLGIYLPAIYLLNLLRIVLLVFVAHRYPSYLNVFHFQVAQGVLIIFVVAFWVGHMRRVNAAGSR